MTEFSNSLYHDTKFSYASGLVDGKEKIAKDLRNEFYKLQISALEANNIKGFFWTWDVPRNMNYTNEWSLKKVLSDLEDTK